MHFSVALDKQCENESKRKWQMDEVEERRQFLATLRTLNFQLVGFTHFITLLFLQLDLPIIKWNLNLKNAYPPVATTFIHGSRIYTANRCTSEYVVRILRVNFHARFSYYLLWFWLIGFGTHLLFKPLLEIRSESVLRIIQKKKGGPIPTLSQRGLAQENTTWGNSWIVLRMCFVSR